nr:AC4 protein [Fraxinus symptomless virus]
MSHIEGHRLNRVKIARLSDQLGFHKGMRGVAHRRCTAPPLSNSILREVQVSEQ